METLTASQGKRLVLTTRKVKQVDEGKTGEWLKLLYPGNPETERKLNKYKVSVERIYSNRS